MYDDQYTGQGGKAAAERLVNQDKVKFIIGPVGAPPALSMITRYSSSGSGYCSGASPTALSTLGYLVPDSLRACPITSIWNSHSSP
jgi:ABC-type branched-subunit amino acid transport system substrate-binding protein